MIKTPAQQLTVAIAAPVIVSSAYFLFAWKKIKTLVNKTKLGKTKCIKKALLPLAIAMYASAGYGSFLIYLRSTFMGPPMSGTSKAISHCANKALVAYCTATLLSLTWLSHSAVCVKGGLLIAGGFLATSLCTLKKFCKIDKVASKAFAPMAAFSVVATIVSVELYALLDNQKKSATGKKLSNFIKKSHCTLVNKNDSNGETGSNASSEDITSNIAGSSTSKT